MDNVLLSKEERGLDAKVEVSILLRGSVDPINLVTTYEWAMGFHFAWTEFVKDGVKWPIASIKAISGEALHFLLSEFSVICVRPL